MMIEVQKTVRLANGAEMPTIGYGTWQVENNKAGADAVAEAIKAGYRHIDGAARYENEVSVGEGIRKSGIAREELFVTSKVWFTHRSYDKVIEACDTTLKDLGLDYLDLYLIHWPAVARNYENWEAVNAETWRAMEEIYRTGKAKAIGVSNFLSKHLEPLLKTAEIVPMVNQIEFHPGYPQTECVTWCREHGIVPEAWRPLGAGAALTGDLMKELSEKYGKTPAQICLRWVLQHGLSPLVKSANPVRMRENLDVYDFTLSAEDMERMDTLPRDEAGAEKPEELVER
ncbi:MAG: aldo/keto reductase [Lachnospiraceae bacterium]|nr:aldo/keto reductase [Lachnospiraceae bacterium]